jgi:hypothetical protein
MPPDSLLATAKALATLQPRRPRQSDLKRAASTTYYAIFHALAQICANELIGNASAREEGDAWIRVYRALDHGTARNACRNAIPAGFPKAVRDFADAFVDLQLKRFEADYDPRQKLSKSWVLNDIEHCRKTIDGLRNAPRKFRRALASIVLFKSR